MRQVITIDPCVTEAHWLFGATTMLMDRAVPALERILLPPAHSPGGTITVTLEEGALGLSATRGGLRALRHRLRRDRAPTGIVGPMIDMRGDAPDNFSHALMGHIPLCAVARKTLDQDVTVVLPHAIPGHIRRAFALCGFTTIATDQAVPGSVCRVENSSGDIMKQAAVPLLRETAARLHAAAAGGAPPLPRKAFVARRGGRAIGNQAEIEAVLHPRGFVTVYAEDLAVADQFRLYQEATHVAGVHGAGLAPIVYRSPERPSLKLLEILPAAHMTNYHRFPIHQIGGRYVAVRGRITAADAAAAYRFGDLYAANSLAPFEVDPATITAALETIEAAAA